MTVQPVSVGLAGTRAVRKEEPGVCQSQHFLSLYARCADFERSKRARPGIIRSRLGTAVYERQSGSGCGKAEQREQEQEECFQGVRLSIVFMASL